MADISLIQNHSHISFREQVLLTAKLSVPAILAQLSTIMMQYIDASMDKISLLKLARICFTASFETKELLAICST